MILGCESFLWAFTFNWAATLNFQQCGMCDQQRLRPACAYAQSGQTFASHLNIFYESRLLIEHHFGFLSLKKGCTGSCESTLAKMPHCGNRMSRLNYVWEIVMTIQYTQCERNAAMSIINIGHCFLLKVTDISRKYNGFDVISFRNIQFSRVFSCKCVRMKWYADVNECAFGLIDG